LFQFDAHSVTVLGDYALKESTEVASALAFLKVGLEGVNYVLRRQQLTIVELDIISQLKGVDCTSVADGRQLARNLWMYSTVRCSVDEIAVGQDRDRAKVMVAVVPWMQVRQRA